MIYYSLSCTRAATNALDVSQIIFFFRGRGEGGGLNKFSLIEDFAKKCVKEKKHTSPKEFCCVSSSNLFFIFILPSCSFGDKPKWLQLAMILVVISQIAKRLRWKIGHYYCLEPC